MHGRIIDLATHARSDGVRVQAQTLADEAVDLVVARRCQPRDLIYTGSCALASDPDSPIATVHCRLVLDPASGRWQAVDLRNPNYERVMRGFDECQLMLLNDLVNMFVDQSA